MDIHPGGIQQIKNIAIEIIILINDLTFVLDEAGVRVIRE